MFVKRSFLTLLLFQALIFLLSFSNPGDTFTSASGLPDSGNGMVFIPAGYFLMGTGPESGKMGEDYGIAEEPRHRVYLKAFYIDRYEITVGQYKPYLKETGRTWAGDPKFPNLFPPETYFSPAERDPNPVNYVSWGDADGYCRWAGKRLPTEEEWEKAARGTEGKTHPWGDRYEPGKANSIDEELGGPMPVGSFPEDRSPFGLYDVAGNLQEWTSSHYLPYAGSPIQRDGRWSTEAFVLKGGSFLLPGKLFARPAYRSAAYPDYTHRSFGFRCVKDAR